MNIIGGKYKRHKLFSPKKKSIRPSSGQLREALFNICQNQIEGARFLDLFAGSGAIGLEALSRGASKVTFVENDKEALATLKKNINSLHVAIETEILPFDVFKALDYLNKKKMRFDLIFADPPYGDTEHSLSNAILDFVDTHPILAEGGILFLEDSAAASKEMKELSALQLIDKRKFGRSILRRYE